MTVEAAEPDAEYETAQATSEIAEPPANEATVEPIETADDVETRHGTDETPADRPAEAGALAAARREAASYRHRLRQSEGEVEELRAEVDTHRRRQIDGVLQGTAGELHDPADVWQFTGLTVSDLFNDGQLDETRLTAALGELRTARPYLFKHAEVRGPRDGGAQGGLAGPPDVSQTLRRAVGG